MTREEAIDLLDNLIGMIEDNHNSDYDTAFRMAIKALEQEPCGNCISRQATLEAFGLSEKSRKYGGDHSGYDTLMKYEIQDVLEALPPVNPQEPKWIPVSERMPEDKQSVLVWCPQYKNIYCAYLEKEQWWIFGAFVQIVPNEVLAWMPLPKPYESQESEDDE